MKKKISNLVLLVLLEIVSLILSRLVNFSMAQTPGEMNNLYILLVHLQKYVIPFMFFLLSLHFFFQSLKELNTINIKEYTIFNVSILIIIIINFLLYQLAFITSLMLSEVIEELIRIFFISCTFIIYAKKTKHKS